MAGFPRLALGFSRALLGSPSLGSLACPKRLSAFLLLTLFVGCGGGSPRGSAATPGHEGNPEESAELMVFAAASLADVTRDLAAAFEAQEQAAGRSAHVVLNLAGSNALAQQIRAIEGPDVFLSADRAWVDVLEEAGRIVPASRRDVFSNRLVLTVRADSPIEIPTVEELARADFRHLSVADPSAVPAGRYAKAYLSALDDPSSRRDIWSLVEPRVVPALDARAALGLVQSDPSVVGIVYRTDVLATEALEILDEIPSLESQPIVYCATVLQGALQPQLAERFLAFMMQGQGPAIISRHGFQLLEESVLPKREEEAGGGAADGEEPGEEPA